METLKLCLCCLLPADKDLKTPYSRRGAQTYTDMLEDCFQIHLTMGGDGKCGICEVCVGRLRDASDFKLQVQLGQVELQRLQGILNVKVEELVDEPEIPCVDHGDVFQRDPLVKAEIDDVMTEEHLKTGSVAPDPKPISSSDYLYNRRFLIDHNYAKTDDHSVKSETDIELPLCTYDGHRKTSPIIPATSAWAVSARAREQLAADCFVRLERLRGDEARASQTCLATPLLSGVLSNGESSHAESESEDNNSPFKCQERQKTIDVEDGVIKGNVAVETITLFSGDSSDAESVISECEDNNSPFKYQECQETFNLEDSLTEHMAVHAKGSVATETNTLSNEEGETYDAESGPLESEHDNSWFKCEKCQEIFDLEDSLTEHMAVHAKGSVATETNTLSNEEGETYDAESGPSEAEHDNSLFKCQECQKTFDLEDSLTSHMAVHSNGSAASETKTHECKLCCEVFELKSDYIKHMEIHVGLQCGLCEKVLANRPGLRNHMRTHTEEKRYSCELCAKKFLHKYGLKKHKKSHKGGIFSCQQNTCNICCQTFEQKTDLTKHMETHDDLRCGLCEKVFANRDSLRVHMRRTHTGEKPYSCELCDKKFGQKHHLKKHIMHYHKVDMFLCPKKFIALAELKEHELVHTEKRTDSCENTCNICHLTFEQKTELTKHMEIHNQLVTEREHDNSPFKCQECQKTFDLEDSLTEHMAVHATGSVATETNTLSNEEGETYDAESGPSEAEHDISLFKCQECQKTFDLEDSLTEHMAVHATGSVATETNTLSNEEGETYEAESGPSEAEHDNSLFKCQECQKTFDLEDSLTEHMAVHAKGTVATETKTYVCRICSKIFELISDFIKHMDIHVGLQCGLCEKVLANRTSLRNHIKTHTGEKPYSCELCGKKFLHKHVLKKHKKSQRHKIFSCQQNTCNICFQTFDQRTDFTKHMETHDDLRRGLCEKVLANRNSLRVHMRTHTGEKPYSCELCDKKFGQKHHFKMHIMHNHKVDMFLCQRCPKKFIALAELKEHELVHTEKRTDSCENTCNICHITFEQKTELTKHMEIHNQLVTEREHDNSPFKCQECQKTFDLEDSLTEHMAVHAKGSVATETSTLSNEEGETYDAESGPSEAEHDNSPFKCQECQKTFDLEDSLTEHMAVHAKGSVATETNTLSNEEGETYDAESGPSEAEHDNSLFKCQECQKTFHLEDSLTEHMAVHAKGSVATEAKTYVCIICSKIFELIADFIKHMDIHVGLQCGLCEKVLANRTSLLSHIRTHAGEKPYFCELCDKKFGHKNNLKRHIMKYHKGYIFPCQRCPKQFIALDELKDHELEHTEILKRFSCVVCNRKFRHNHNLKQHMQSHQREDQHQISSKKFAEQSHLKEQVLENKLKKPYVCENKCDFCCQSFKLKTDLTKHMEIHKEPVETKDLWCRLCKKVYASKFNLKAHMSTHTGQEPYSCQVCSTKFGRKQHLKRHHMETHKGKGLFFCQICPKQFTDQIELKKHELVHAEKKSQIFTCETCKRGFGSNIHLQIHMLEHKKERKKETIIRDKEKVFTCKICRVAFKKKSLLDNHVKTHIDKSHTCEICEAKFKNESHLMTHLNTHIKNRPFACDVCKKQFSLKSQLATHMRLHPREKRYSCDVCKKQFAFKSSLHTHKRTHTVRNRYSCDVCQKQFMLKRNFESHLLLHADTIDLPADTRDKCFCCEMCGKYYRNKDKFISHINEHMGVRPYICDTCNKRFTNENALKIHKQIHTREKSFACDTCNRRFSMKAALKCHMIIHTGLKPFSCEICKRQFSFKCALRVHMLGHSGEKPHVCNVCQKAFFVLSQLTLHKLNHKEERPFPCHVCAKAFVTKYMLKKHLLSRHTSK